MTFGTKRTRNKEIGYLHFTNGRTVRLNQEELRELYQKIRFWQAEGLLKAEEHYKDQKCYLNNHKGGRNAKSEKRKSSL